MIIFIYLKLTPMFGVIGVVVLEYTIYLFYFIFVRPFYGGYSRYKLLYCTDIMLFT